MKPLTSRKLLFVVGMHRSGTSALCAALQASGASFGSDLLDPMSDVNDEGFWEDSELVAINEALLEALAVNWYSVSSDLTATDWAAEVFSDLRVRAKALLERGFGDGALQAIKDPRLCVTLPFWRAICDEIGVETKVLVISRAPLEIARSLEKRDGFPLGYGLYLYLHYRKCIAANCPQDTQYVTYDQLLAGPAMLMQQLADSLPLLVDEDALGAAVRGDLKHHSTEGDGSLLERADDGTIDFTALEAALEKDYPQQRLMAELVAAMVARGQELSEKGIEFEVALGEKARQHIEALATLDERDQQIAGLDTRLAEAGRHLSEALATISERDEQLVGLDQRLATLGDEHSHALSVLRERDEQLDALQTTRDKIFKMPLIGMLFKALWYHARG
ncbi:MAG: hypothetical protein V7754_08645 [Halioglobus sp.]